MNRFTIIANRSKDIEGGYVAYIEGILSNHNKIYESYYLNNDDDYDKSYVNMIDKRTECLIVLGGDGTLLQIATDTIEYGIPLLGVNLGTIGYLTEVEWNDIDNAIISLINDEYRINRRMMLDGSIIRQGKVIAQETALNDVVLYRSGNLNVVKYRINIDGEYLYSVRADGIIVSSPTGSTGYNMSAGGPIIEPMAEAMVLTPIAAHTLESKNIVFGRNNVIEMSSTSGKCKKTPEVSVAFDGGRIIRLKERDIVSVKVSKLYTKLISLRGGVFLKKLKLKMRK